MRLWEGAHGWRSRQRAWRVRHPSSQIQVQRSEPETPLNGESLREPKVGAKSAEAAAASRIVRHSAFNRVPEVLAVVVMVQVSEFVG